MNDKLSPAAALPATEGLRLTSFSHGGGCGCKIAPGVLSEILRSSVGGLVPPRAAGRHRDRRRRCRLPAQRRAGADRHHRLLHADRRRPVRLRPHRRDQRHQRRLCHGRQADHGAGPGGHADRPAAGRGHRQDHPRRRVGLPRGRHPDRRRPHHRFGRADLRPGRAWAWCTRTRCAATPMRRPATCWCSASRSASACCRRRSRRTRSTPPATRS